MGAKAKSAVSELERIAEGGSKSLRELEATRPLFQERLARTLSNLPARELAEEQGVAVDVPAGEAEQDRGPGESSKLTKAEFLDQLAGDDRIGSQEAARDALDAVLEAITGALASGDEVSLTGFGKFHLADVDRHERINPRTGERMAIVSGKVPRFSAESELESKLER